MRKRPLLSQQGAPTTPMVPNLIYPPRLSPLHLHAWSVVPRCFWGWRHICSPFSALSQCLSQSRHSSPALSWEGQPSRQREKCYNGPTPRNRQPCREKTHSGENRFSREEDTCGSQGGDVLRTSDMASSSSILVHILVLGTLRARHL